MNVTETIIYGILSGIIASILTLIGERLIRAFTLKRRLVKWRGNYNIINNSRGLDTSEEKITIKYLEGYQFSICSSGGPCGDWDGTFFVDSSCEDFAHGAYRYPNKLDWGHHELLCDNVNKQIHVWGINRSKPGDVAPFSVTYNKK